MFWGLQKKDKFTTDHATLIVMWHFDAKWALLKRLIKDTSNLMTSIIFGDNIEVG